MFTFHVCVHFTAYTLTLLKLEWNLECRAWNSYFSTVAFVILAIKQNQSVLIPAETRLCVPCDRVQRNTLAASRSCTDHSYVYTWMFKKQRLNVNPKPNNPMQTKREMLKLHVRSKTLKWLNITMLLLCADNILLFWDRINGMLGDICIQMCDKCHCLEAFPNIYTLF